VAATRLCSVPDCDKPHFGLGYCQGHYLRVTRHGDPLFGGKFKRRTPTPKQKCSVDGCEGIAKARGWCGTHYWRWQTHGDPMQTVGLTPGTLRRWLESHLDFSEQGCLRWPFNKGDGRGTIHFDGHSMSPSRAMCILTHGDPPSPLHVAAHSCGKGHEGCVSPLHLSWKTQIENAADKVAHGTHNRGVQNPRAKLTETDVLEIRAARGLQSQRSLAIRYGVTQSMVYSIQVGRAWSYL
jgi:hypothetical protein